MLVMESNRSAGQVPHVAIFAFFVMIIQHTSKHNLTNLYALIIREGKIIEQLSFQGYFETTIASIYAGNWFV